MEWPRLLVVRQKFPDLGIGDIPAAVQAELAASPLAERLAPGSRIAIGVGSRGIANIATIVRSVVAFWKDRGVRPHIFPAMGSHGAATAEGQAAVLAHYGITEASAGCPVLSSLDVVPLGATAEGIETFIDRTAFESDGVMLVARVKWHTDFAGTIESGLFKMMAIGLGKFAGAKRYHVWGLQMGLENMIRAVGRQVLASGKIAGGLAIVEDARHQTAKVVAVAPQQMESREEELLREVKAGGARIPFREIDLLIVDQIGKDISGAGMDTKVINRNIQCEYNPWPDTVLVRRIFARDLSEGSYGNAIGIGMCDVVAERLVKKVDWTPTRINAWTSGTFPIIRTPVHFPSDRECIEAIWTTVGKHELKDVRLGWIANTQDLETLAVTENLRQEVERNPALEIVGEAEFRFDDAGNLKPVFAREACANK